MYRSIYACLKPAEPGHVSLSPQQGGVHCFSCPFPHPHAFWLLINKTATPIAVTGKIDSFMIFLWGIGHKESAKSRHSTYMVITIEVPINTHFFLSLTTGYPRSMPSSKKATTAIYGASQGIKPEPLWFYNKKI